MAYVCEPKWSRPGPIKTFQTISNFITGCLLATVLYGHYYAFSSEARSWITLVANRLPAYVLSATRCGQDWRDTQGRTSKASSVPTQILLSSVAGCSGQDPARGSAERNVSGRLQPGGNLLDTVKLELAAIVPSQHRSLLLPMAVNLEPHIGEIDSLNGPVCRGAPLKSTTFGA